MGTMVDKPVYVDLCINLDVGNFKEWETPGWSDYWLDWFNKPPLEFDITLLLVEITDIWA